MRLGFFSILSVGVHAAALAYPITFASRTVRQPIHATVLPAASELEAPAGQGGSGGSLPSQVQANRGQRPALPPCCGARTSSDRALEGGAVAEQRDMVREPDASVPPEIESAGDSTVTMIAAPDAPADARQMGTRGSSENPTRAAGGEMNATGNQGGGSGFEAGAVTGVGAGPGTGLVSGKAMLQASYRDTPRPEYPESARRAGQEGRVLLRVLVDARGRSKQVEIHSSSGSDALDHAAAAAIRRWRFDPARHGQQAVESWLRIPVDFRLTDAKHR